MTIAQIHKEADERYQVPPTACRQERKLIAHLKQRFIDKKMIEFGFIKQESKVNLPS